MCWGGSGFEFSSITTTTVANVTIYTGMLIKDGKRLHTAWWYTNGEIKTISQLDWRLRMLKGEPNFSLINVTADDGETLMKSVHSMFTTDPIVIDHL
jgi:hypothetical protein